MKPGAVSGIFSLLLGSVLGASTFEPARPPAIPLAVRSPYLNTWLNVGSDGGSGGYLAGTWPTFWPGAITGWAGLIRVDGATYTWMGNPGPAAVNQTDFQYTATRSTFIMNVAGQVGLNVTFLSPLFPHDLQRQSLAFSYLNVAVFSLDGAEHEVQVYADISAEWVSGNRGTTAEWDYGVTGSDPGIAYHKVWRQTQLAFSEAADQTEFGNYYWATNNVENLSYQSGADSAVRGAFRNNGALSNSEDTNFRAINNNWPVFGFAVDLGSVGATAVDTLFSIGLTQEFAVQFNGADGNVSMPALWTDYFSDELAALTFFHNDYAHASATGGSFDSQVLADATAAAGDKYYAIVALTARQAFAATQLVGTSDNPYMFLKEISSNGNTNTVDVIFPMHPILLYSNPELLNLLLKPLFENQESGRYPNDYAMHDLGAHFPNATGHEDGLDEPMPLEECGNMIIMVLAYFQRTNNLDYLNQHYAKLQQWVGYLIDEALIPFDQLSTDDFAGTLANQTNLALKGIIGIEAMAQISNVTGHASDAANYTSIAHNYIDQWQDLGISNTSVGGGSNLPHTTLSYGNNASYNLLYNLYADALLNVNLVPRYVYDMQSEFYPTVFNTYGPPLDTRHSYTKTDWELWCAAIASTSTRDQFHDVIFNWISKTPTNKGFTDLYETATGDYPGGLYFIARPVMGGSFALLTLNGVTNGIGQA